MRKRNKTDELAIQKASYGVDGLKKWVIDLFYGRASQNYRLPDEIFELWLAEVIGAYEKAKNHGDRQRIMHKILHTREVVEAGMDIMEGEKEFDWDRYQVVSVCLLHDLARFRQALLGAFSDEKTNFNHAEEGAKMIEKTEWAPLRYLGLDQRVIAEAVRHHSRMKYLGDDPYVKLTRDADKLALLRYMPYLIKEDAYPKGGVSSKVLTDFKKGLMVKNDDRITRADIYVSWACWESDLFYRETKDRYVNEGIKTWIYEALKEMTGEDLI
ncbi:MAG: hypothetical protein UW26_C0015G0006 [Candidatus Collierbacteria bacterium GW2011_GWF1_44_12]|uniref:Uncharacterized protein n=3 Tax=Candidatus Collieribacteriota TaxID=1752725 RepID=A0A0G1GKF5_9BACT|nr:MAG: hypothetical protein UW23_C0024G0010 [Candidatus Collierbacteria bacterium GW2011_GWA1_44_12]KKT38641.1 MAG: hypothetical protein UW26_C0015G0006 [Candidatus Collierbacteria bacterium GW2011_GWF1_44_12]KKT98935.1 MAG: hypothetical protein UW99_C0013G0011 [Candidatus Collierbacteria bacterium GW2011_GWC2_45_15]